MGLVNNKIINRIVAILVLSITLTLFMFTPVVNASRLTIGDNDFYYAGVTEGTYVKAQSFWEWLVGSLSEIIDYLLGIITYGIRAVFVGWTALFEQLFTWVMETTTGIPMDLDNMNSNDLSKNTDSSGNITLEAILFNKVPILNANIFDEDTLEYNDHISGTGQYWVVCKECAPEEPHICKMDECSCATCADYITKSHTKLGYDPTKNASMIIREKILEWYKTIRLISIAGMLIVLIFAGVKMAIVTVAEQRAIYQKMIMDWVVGIVIVFTTQYMMAGIFYFNDIFLDNIKKLEVEMASKISTSSLNKSYSRKSYSYNDIEIDAYEEVRTRAYDVKLINGVTGMVMYMTLFYLSVRFTLKYLKRYFTIIVLTIISPGVGFGHALSKTMSGRGSLFSSWLHEYFVTVFIQSIHALIYAAFVTTALAVSLNSLAGMVLAFVIMNSMFGFEDVFRKIFKFTSSTGSDNAPSFKDSMGTLRAAAGIMMAGNLLKNSPITKAAMAPAKALGSGIVTGISKARDADIKLNFNANSPKDFVKIDKEGGRKKREQEMLDRFDKKNEAMKDVIARAGIEGNKLGEFFEQNGVFGHEAREKAQELLSEMYEKAVESGDEAEIERIRDLQAEFDEVSGFTREDIIKAHIDKLFDSNNYFYTKNIDKNAAMKKYIDKFTAKEMKKSGGEERKHFNYKVGEQVKTQYTETKSDFNKRRKIAEEKALKKATKKVEKLSHKRYRKNGLFGSLELNPATGKLERQTQSKLVREQLNSRNLLGFTDADKKLLDQNAVACLKNTLVGTGSLFLGLSTVVANPVAGIALLSVGNSKTISALNSIGINMDAPKRLPYKKRFYWSRFSSKTKRKISKSVLKLTKLERTKRVINNVKQNNPNLYKGIKTGTAIARGGVKGAVIVGTAGMVFPAKGAFRLVKAGVKTSASILGGNMNRGMNTINEQHFKQIDNLYKQFEKQALIDYGMDLEDEFDEKYDILVDGIDKDVEKLSLDELEIYAALSAENAIEKDGEIIYIRKPSHVDDLFIIEQSVLEVSLSHCNLDITKFDINSNKSEVIDLIESKLLAQGLMQKGENVQDVIDSLDAKIIQAKENLDKQQRVSEEEGDISKTDEYIFEETLKEYIEQTEITDVSEINPELLQKSFHKKKEEKSYSKGVQPAIEKLKEQKSDAEKQEPDYKLYGDSEDEQQDIETKQQELDMVKKQLSKVIELNNSDNKKQTIGDILDISVSDESGNEYNSSDIIERIKNRANSENDTSTMPKDTLDSFIDYIIDNSNDNTNNNSQNRVESYANVDDIVNNIKHNDTSIFGKTENTTSTENRKQSLLDYSITDSNNEQFNIQDIIDHVKDQTNEQSTNEDKLNAVLDYFTKNNEETNNQETAVEYKQKTEDVVSKMERLKRAEKIKQLNELNDFFFNSIEENANVDFNQMDNENSNSGILKEALEIIESIKATNKEAELLKVDDYVLNYRKEIKHMYIDENGNNTASRNNKRNKRLGNEVYGPVSDIADLIDMRKKNGKVD